MLHLVIFKFTAQLVLWETEKQVVNLAMCFKINISKIK